MSIKQISVFLENKPGTLQTMTAALADKSIVRSEGKAVRVIDKRKI